MNDVATELVASKIPPSAWQFVLALCFGEGGIDSNAWRRCYGGSLYTGPLTAVFNRANPLWNGKQGPAGMSHALGAGQFQPGTYQDTAEHTGLITIEPQSQLANIWNLMQRVYGPTLESDLASGQQTAVAIKLAPTWTSLGLAKFASRYASAAKTLAAVTKPPTPVPPTPGPDPEFAAMMAILAQMETLAVAAQQRVLTYIKSRLSLT